MTRLEKLIEDIVPKDAILIDYRKYNGGFETTDLQKNTEVYYISHRNTDKDPLLLKLLITSERVNSCINCSLSRFDCKCIDCNAKLIKVYKP